VPSLCIADTSGEDTGYHCKYGNNFYHAVGMISGVIFVTERTVTPFQNGIPEPFPGIRLLSLPKSFI
jgi:hypothetical protein